MNIENENENENENEDTEEKEVNVRIQRDREMLAKLQKVVKLQMTIHDIQNKDIGEKSGMNVDYISRIRRRGQLSSINFMKTLIAFPLQPRMTIILQMMFDDLLELPEDEQMEIFKSALKWY